MSDREPKGWITVNGHHVPIFDKDVKAFDFKQHGSMAQYIDKNRDDNIDFDKDKATEQFIEKTGVSVSSDVKDKCSAENLQMIYETISNIQDEYGIGILKDIQEMKNPEGGCPAAIREDGVLFINTELFAHSKDYMELYYQEAVLSGEHVKGNASSIIAHEMGHCLLYKQINDSVSTTGLMGGIEKDFIKKFFDTKRYNANIGNRYKTYKMFGEKMNGLMTNNKPTDISSSADLDYHETIAEAFADVYYSGRRAKKLSRSIYKEFFE